MIYMYISAKLFYTKYKINFIHKLFFLFIIIEILYFKFSIFFIIIGIFFFILVLHYILLHYL